MSGPTDSTRGRRKRVRPMLLAQLAAAGTMPCPRCGQPMTIEMALDVGHEVDVTDGGWSSPLRLEHRGCNRKAGDRRRGRNRKAGTPRVAGQGRVNRTDRDVARRAAIDKRELDRLNRMRRARILLPRLGP